MRTVITGLVAALAIAGGATEAQAFEWHESKTKTVRKHIDADACTGVAKFEMVVPAYADRVEVVSPQVGQQAWGYGAGERGRVQVTSAYAEENWASFELQTVGDWCALDQQSYREWDDCDYYYYDDYCENGVAEGWETDPVKFTLSYQVRKRLVMGRGLARNLASEALSRRFSWFGDANHGGYKCKVTANRGRCEHVFVIGDAAVKAAVTSRLVRRDGQKPLWSYHVSSLRIDEYCRFVTQAGNCTARFTKKRSRVTLPYWVTGKTVG